ncbi:PREDICTED: pentatricopeptide repeat-containing protein At3g23020 [Ipomoea nil]|uniref:pentatricopeptide repeat-containing protein At3g23020 n=1 Tax=Ipomoea nil TaxID=35883 RepID=UPI00090188FC|nr:PREDICTED: pentatricopeptide repeat-containing protein At3g23020 [Ipomoea nil]
MFAKFQHFDTNCFYVRSSTKITPRIGISVKPARKDHHQRKIQLNPDGRSVESKNVGVKLGPNVGLGDVRKNLQNQKSTSLDERNGVLKSQTGLFTKRDGRVEGKKKSGGETRRGNLHEKVQTKCSTKWGRYGGCIPAILEALESCDDLDEALKPWEMTLTNKERSIILKEQLGWERASEIFNWFKKKGCYEVNVIHYNIMLRTLGRAHRWSEVEKLCDEMRGRSIKPVNSTYGTLIDVYSKGGRREEAMKWLDLMNQRGMEPDEVTMGTVVQMYKKAGEFKKAEEFFKKWSLNMQQVEQPVNGKPRRNISSAVSSICLSSYTYNNLIDTYGKAGQVKEASETFERMVKEGIAPTTVTFNTMIHLYGNNGQLEEVGSLMRKMEELKCCPDTRTYNILIFLHAKHDNIEMAANYFKLMKSASLEPDTVSYRTLLYAFSIRQMVCEADMLILEMDERGLEIDEFTQSALTRMYLVAGMLERAWSWFWRFHLGGEMTSECYSANIDAFGEHGHILEGEKVFNCCQEVKRLTVLEFNVMIKAYGISKKYDEACFLFDSMQNHDISPDRCSYSSLIQMLAGADLPVKAKSYVSKMQEAGLVDDCVPYSVVISSFIKLGQLEMAVSLYKEMIRFGIQPDVVVYAVLINAFADIGSVKDVNCYFDDMRKAGLQMNTVICNSLIKIYSKVGYLKEAEEIYETLLSFEDGPDIYSSNCMIDLYSLRSMVGQAEEVFEHLRRKGIANEFSYAMMLCMYKRNGRFNEAIRIAKAMRDQGLLTDLLSYNNVLGLYAVVGRFKDAMATFKEMLTSSTQPDDFTFKSLGIILVKCGVPKETVGKLKMMRKKDPQKGLLAWTSILSSVTGLYDTDNAACMEL